jgi:hypothetical protein
LLQDAAAGALKPLYNYMDDLPSLEGTPIPLMAAERAQRTAPNARWRWDKWAAHILALVTKPKTKAGAKPSPKPLKAAA